MIDAHKNVIIAQPNTIDTKFMDIASNDLNINGETLQTEVASVSTRTIVDNSSDRSIVFDTVSNIPEAYRIDTKPWVERPFYCDQVKFSTSASRFDMLNSTIRFVPGDIARSNPNLLNAFKMASMGRSDLVLNVSMAGTIGHAGCVLVAVLPPMHEYPDRGALLINTALTGPHAFLFANEATSVVIPVPWYCNTDMMTLDMEQREGYFATVDITKINGNYGTLVFIVLNPLAVSDSSVNELSIVVEACFKNLDMVVPTPRFVEWQAQAGMVNPTYEDIDKILDQIENLRSAQDNLPKKRKLSKLQLLSILSAVVNLTHLVLDALKPVDVISAVATAAQFVPQAGFLGAVGSAVMPGLIGSVASKGTKLFGDILDKGIGALRKFTGLHNPNEATITTRVVNTDVNFANMVDGKQFFEKLDPYSNSNRVVQEHVFGTTIDEMDITNITSKDQFLGTFKVSQKDTLGKLVWARPISPFQGGAGYALDGVVCSNNLELMHSLHRAWRGGLTLKLQSVMNNKQQVKLKVIKYYNPGTLAASAQPVYTSVVNAPSHLLEFSQGGQTQDVDLPYLCRNALCPRAENPDAEAFIHGMYYIYIAQPLVSADGSPEQVEFNVYMSGQPDLQFYGYTTSNLGWHGFNSPLVPSINRELQATQDFIAQPISRFIPSTVKLDFTSIAEAARYINKHQSDIVGKYGLPAGFFENEENYTIRNGVITHVRIPKKGVVVSFNDGKTVENIIDNEIAIQMKPQSGSIEVMNEPQEQRANMTSQRTSMPIECTRLQPNINMRDIVRRMYKTEASAQTFNPQETITRAIPLAAFLYEKPNEYYYTPMGMASRMYYGKTVGFKFRISLTHDRVSEGGAAMADLHTRVYYQPQTLNINTTDSTINGSLVNKAAYQPITTTSTIGEPPMPYQLTPVKSQGNNLIYEFTIPDTSFYKFMGSPNKFMTFSSATVAPNLSTADFGTFILEITNLNAERGLNVITELYVGLTDESRFGFHSMAPPFRIRKTNAYYLGTNTSDTDPPQDAVNPRIYYGSYAV